MSSITFIDSMKAWENACIMEIVLIRRVLSDDFMGKYCNGW